MLKLDRFSCSQKIRLKWDPPYATIKGRDPVYNFFCTYTDHFANIGIECIHWMYSVYMLTYTLNVYDEHIQHIQVGPT